MTVLDAKALDSRDCAWPGCAQEAENADGMCRYHRGRTPAVAPVRIQDERGRLVPGALAHLMEDEAPAEPIQVVLAVAPQPPIEETAVPPLCKIDGCDGHIVDRRGMYASLCATHKREKQAARQSAKPLVRLQVAEHAAEARTQEEPKLAKPVEAPPGGLTALAQAVDQAQLELDAAIAAHTAALTALRAAVEAA